MDFLTPVKKQSDAVESQVVKTNISSEEQMDMWIDVSPWDHQRGTQPHHVAS
jgi:hypothetical protein